MLTKRVFAWAMYDLANTSFSALVVTLFFPALITQYLGGNEFHVGLVMGASLLVAAILVPLLGGIADATKVKKPFIVSFTILTVAFTILIAFANLWWALIFAFLANICYHASLDIYDSYLPEISKRSTLGRVSGIGTAFGYLGTVLSLLMTWAVLSHYGWVAPRGTRMMFIASGIFFLIFSLFLFFMVKDRKKIMSHKRGIVHSLHEVKKTIKEKQYRNIWKFFLASFLFIDAISTVIAFLFLYGNTQLGITVQEFFPLYVGMALAAMAGSLAFGKYADHTSPKKALLTALSMWMVVITLLIAFPNYWVYVGVGLVGGALLGGVWTTTRHLLVHIAPQRKMAELFGFQGLTEKLGGIGPLIFGFVVVQWNYAFALGLVLVFFFLGVLVLLRVREKHFV